MKNKKTIVMSTLLLAIVLLGIGTIAYFRRTVNGNITGEAGNLTLIVNEVSAEDDESFNITLKRSEEEPYILPDDSGVFNLNIDSTGSSVDVAVSVSFTRTNLPNNLKFYLDEKHTTELTTKSFIINKSDDMTLTIPVYWFWDGSVDDVDDSKYINTTISASVNVKATTVNLYNTLLAQSLTLDTNVDFTKGASSTNGEGLMMMDASKNDLYPIIYYRGDVTNNNVVFANKCWLIVRTTETGGTKLIYNGDVNQDGSCTNYSGVGGEAAGAYSGAYIQESAFNSSYDSPVYAGYMYNDTNKFFTHSEGWDGTTNYDNDGVLDATGFKALLANNTIDSGTGRHVQNLKDSNIKGVIDTWYGNNIDGTPSESLIEDTVWCADRSVTGNTYSIENYATNRWFGYSAATRILQENGKANPTLECTRDVDKFTVSDALGNGDLTYPVGLLTMDEIWMVGNTYYVDNNTIATTYLTIPEHYYWALSPCYFDHGDARVFAVYRVDLVNRDVSSSRGVRPSISLSKNATISQGNGSFEQPYLVG